MPSPRFVLLDHAADIKFTTSGRTPSEVFANASAALTHYMADGRRISPRLVTRLELSSDNQESLLYSFLDELLYLVDAESFVVSKAEIVIEGTKLVAVLYGDDTRKYQLKHVKAATYAEMYIKETMKGWEAQVVLDV